MDYFQILSAISLPLGILILLLLICRSLVLWYFKIPDMIKRQDDLISVIKKQNALLEKFYGVEKNEGEENKKPSFYDLKYGKKK